MSIGIRPAGVKMFGANLISPGYQHYLFQNWASLWTSWTRPQIDMFIACGMNCLRLQGGTEAVHSGALSLADYAAAWVQVAAYCQTRGIYLYPCEYMRPDLVQGLAGYTTGAITNAQYAAIVAATMVALNPYSSIIIGFDAWQEFDNECMHYDTASTTRNKSSADAAAIRTLIEAALVTAGVTLPYGMTFSSADVSPFANHVLGFAAACDFIDLHIYPWTYGFGGSWNGNSGDLSAGGTVPSKAAVLEWSAAFSNKDIIFGEYGCWVLGTNPTPEYWIGRVIDIMMAPDGPLRGALIYGMQHDASVPHDYTDFFLMTYTGVINAPMTKPVISHTSTLTSPGTPAKPVLINDRLYINPCLSTNFSKVKWYKNGSLLSSTDVGKLDDSASWTTTRANYQAAILDTTAAEGTKSEGLWVGSAAKLFNPDMFNQPMFSPSGGISSAQAATRVMHQMRMRRAA